MYVCMYVCTSVRKYACMHVCGYACICMQACMHVCIQSYAHICAFSRQKLLTDKYGLVLKVCTPRYPTPNPSPFLNPRSSYMFGVLCQDLRLGRRTCMTKYSCRKFDNPIETAGPLHKLNQEHQDHTRKVNTTIALAKS